ncbi:MFS transporter [Mycobacterium sp. CBMA293]|uniref:MFS transporter n=2 Tax=Mycolicibacterium TaxID=1866885 RepID=UPI0012DEB62B|nr:MULTISPECIES: MFS transporter [unclassified Mycolicibacterium]MUL49005.1 MFS transporter [Mycolicibacterium sp. CBMA 360]MUL58580.1 MFS transporter [Mycolicibacterium sp. CBMA 335]MUL74038.1 MFS transporter [Mycolicibacterium sp. CBMA 311]MUL93463.1 MFS transporter [Mycolicibacterium sp. CBMA 230]MUM04681.1 MFS transporter [Mycolicibacterium sp. CBMA 213]
MSSAQSVPTGIRFGSAAGRWVVAATVLGSGMAQLDATVVNVALPAIGRDLGAQASGLQLVVSAYSVTLAALILLSGSLGDRVGRKRVFVIGVVWFTVASALCAMAPTAEMLIAARALQGVGGALLTPGSLAIIQATFIPADRGKAIGAWSALGGVAAAIGPLLGGYLVQAVSWRAIFLINVPLGGLVVWLALRHVPESRDPSAAGRLDYAGATSATVGLAGATYAMVEGPNRGWASPVVVVAAVLGAFAIVAFVVIERRAAHPMLPLDIFSSRQFTSANVVTFVVYTALGGVFFLLVVVLQNALGYSPIAAGAASLPVTAIMLALSSASGALAQRIGPRLPLTVGPLLVAAGMVLMTRIGPGSAYVTTVLPAVIVFGLGLAATVAPVTAATLAAADERHAGVASGVNNAVARTGGLLAVALLPPIAGLTGDAFLSPTALTAGFHTAMLISAGLAAAGGVVAFVSISNDLLTETPTRAPEHQHFSCALAEVPAHERVGRE